jgi:hypothetical protein
MFKVAAGDHTIRRIQVFEWLSNFKSRVTSTENTKQVRHPLLGKTVENMDPVQEQSIKNRRTTILKVANMLGISFGSVQRILKAKFCEKWNLGKWFLQHNDALAHVALSVHVRLAKNKMTAIPYPNNSPHLASWNFFS